MSRKKLASLEVANSKMFVFPVLSFIDSLAQRHTAMDVTRYQQLRFVASEILKQRIEFSYPGSVGSIFVELFLDEGFFEISVRDKGTPGWQDFSYEKDKIANDDLSMRNYLISKYVDEIGMEKLGNDGQRIFVRKKIVNALEFVPPEPYEDTVALDTNITIRPVLTHEDVIEAIRCIYSEYGYSYSYERLYYVNSFMELIKNKEIMSFLAVNDHGQTAGHFALVFSELYKNMPEVSTVVIKKEFRGLGLFSRFMEHSEIVGKEHGFRAIMGQPVTYHPMSQKAFLRAGYTATSLLMDYINDELESEYNKDGERLGLSASVKILDKDAYSKVYLPDELKSFVDKIYSRLGMKYDICSDECADVFTEMSVEKSSALKMSKIIVKKAGSDFEDVLKQALRDVIKQKNDMVELVISMNSPSCGFAYKIAKECEFLVSGIIPGAENGDYLIMQMLPGDSIKFDNLVLVGEFEEIKNDIVNINNLK